jgi:hypothetical protein
MRKALITLVVIVVAVVGVATWYAHQPRQTPLGQPPLDSLNSQNFLEFQNAFNASPSSARLVLLLSPT